MEKLTDQNITNWFVLTLCTGLFTPTQKILYIDRIENSREIVSWITSRDSQLRSLIHAVAFAGMDTIDEELIRFYPFNPFRQSSALKNQYA
jgi:hypothetical protein